MTFDPSSQNRSLTFRDLLVSKVEADTRGESDHAAPRWRPLAVVAAGIVVAGSLAVGSINAPSRELPPTIPEAIDNPLPFAGDENIVQDPSELAADAQLVVLGTVIGVEEVQAPIEVAQPSGIVTTFTLVVSIDETIQGSAATSGDGLLRIAIPEYTTTSRDHSLDDYLQLVPIDSTVVGYLQRGWPSSGGIQNMDPGYTGADQLPLYIPTLSQSLAIQRPGESTVFWPRTGTTKEGNIRDALPGGTLVPLTTE